MGGALVAAILLVVIGAAIEAAHRRSERRQVRARLFAPYSHVRTIDREGEE
jgi:hypothetical protein